MSDSDSPREIARPCSLSVGDMRKAVTKARKRNKVTGPARRAEIMDVIEAHIDNLEGTDALEEIMSQSPLNMTDIHMARAEMKRLFHPRASAMKMQDLIEYIYWTTKGLGWDWQELPPWAPQHPLQPVPSPPADSLPSEGPLGLRLAGRQARSPRPRLLPR